MLAASVAMHGRLEPRVYFMVAGFMFAWCLISALAIMVNLGRTEEGRWLLRSYKQWCPGWMRWSLNLTGGAGAFAPFYHLFNLFDLFGHLSRYLAHEAWAQALVPHLPYAVGCWFFIVTTGFLAAILRSQEELRILVAEA
jgi:hypothetical protein